MAQPREGDKGLPLHLSPAAGDPERNRVSH